MDAFSSNQNLGLTQNEKELATESSSLLKPSLVWIKIILVKVVIISDAKHFGNNRISHISLKIKRKLYTPLP